MRFGFGKIPKNAVLSVFFLLFIFLIAGVSLKQTLHIINEIPLGEKSFRMFFTETREKLNCIYSDMLKFNSPSLVDKGTYIEINGLMAHLMGQRIMNEVIKLENGYLTNVENKFDTSPYISGLKQLNDLCKSRGIEFLYVQAPYKICKHDKQLPAGVSDFTNENTDEFLSLVYDAGIEAIDLRQELHNDGLDHYQAFFMTDHHWTPGTGFWAANKIKNYFVNKGILTNEDTVVSDLSNYNIDIYNNIFIGSYARRTGTNFGGY